MSYSLQVLYPAENTRFDFDYYTTKHMEIVGASIGPQIERTVITRGAPGPDGKLSHHAIATILFADQKAFETALSSLQPAVQDIPNFYDGQPDVVAGQVIG